jgi:tetratricopeptide (TPR) repeat protein
VPPLVVAKATATAARFSARLGRFADARLYGERSREIYRIHGDPADAAYALDTLAWVAQLDGDHDRAATLLEEAIDLARRRCDQGREAVLLMNLGYLMLLRNDDSSAETLLRRSAALGGTQGNPYIIGMSLANLAMIALKRGSAEDAQDLLFESLAAARELGSEEIMLGCIEGLAAVAAARGRTDVAARLLGYAREIQERLGTPLEAYEQAMHDTTVSAVTDVHGPEEAARLIELGRGMTFDEAIALANPD